MNATIPAVVLGAGGYVGGELLRLIAAHPDFDLAGAVSDSREGEPVGETFPHLSQAYRGVCFIANNEWIDRIESGGRVALFSAAPHGASATIVAAALDAARQKRSTFMSSTRPPTFATRDSATTRPFTTPRTVRRNCSSCSPVPCRNTSTQSARRTSVTRAALRQRLCSPQYRWCDPA